MFTAEKSKLFFNDPKFMLISRWNDDSQEEAVNKIFAGQRQLRRSKIAYKAIDSSKQEEASNHFLMLDFLQSRINSFQERLASNVETVFYEKERIKDKYNEAQDLYEKANRKLKRLMVSVRTQKHQFDNLEQVQAEVFDIQRIYEQNQFLKSMNDEIKKRIEKKQLQLGPTRK